MREFCQWRKIAPAAAAFGLTALILCCVFAAFGLYPFGGETLAWGDMSQQVAPLLMELKDILAGKCSLFLNLQNAGGMSFWGVFFFFLASPLHLLVIFVEKQEIYHLVNLLVLIKLSLAALTASAFFRREAPRLSLPVHLALSVSYGLCGYGMLYYQNLVWLDMLYLFPVVMLGFVKLLEEKRAWLLTASLTATVAVNYYLSYMVFLGLILTGTVFLWTCVPKEERGPVAGKLGMSAGSALGITAPVWLPSLLQCLASARTGGGVIESVQAGSFWAKTTTTLPVLLCSAGAAALPVLAIFLPKTAKSKGIGVCWGLTVLPMLLEPVNKLWHMGSYQAFPARYGFWPVFLGLWFLAQGLESCSVKPHRESKKSYLAVCGLLALPVGAGIFLLAARFEEVSSYTDTLWVNSTAFLFLGAFCLLCAAAWSVVCRSLIRKGRNAFMGWALLGVCLVQSAVQSAVFLGSAANVPLKSQEVLALEPPQDDGLYRVKLERKFCHVNLLGAAGYPTLNHYTSLTDRRFLAAVKKLGYSSYWMETSGCCGTKISDVILSNKYVLCDNAAWSGPVGGNLGYLVPAGRFPEALPVGDRLRLQNELCEILGVEGPFAPYAPVSGELQETAGKFSLEPGMLRYEIPVVQRETLYFDAFDCVSTRLREKINDCFQIRVNGQTLAERYPTQGCNGIFCLGEFQDETVRVEVTVRKKVDLCSFGVWGMRNSRQDELAAALPNADLRADGGKLIGHAQAGENQALFLSIPWYQGMEVRVNGRRVTPRIVLDCFMEIPLPAGTSEIILRYIPAGLVPGTAAAALTGICLLLLPKAGKLRFLERIKRRWYKIASALLSSVFVGAILAVYIAPVLLWLL